MTAGIAALPEQDRNEAILDVEETRCCAVGGGPGGVMLALLLARRGVPVTLLESHATFERDFRGDTIHPGLLEILDEIGLADRLHELVHVKMYGPVLPGSVDETPLFDFRQLLKTRFPYIMWMQQSLFLGFLAEEARKHPSFQGGCPNARLRTLAGARAAIAGRTGALTGRHRP